MALISPFKTLIYNLLEAQMLSQAQLSTALENSKNQGILAYLLKHTQIDPKWFAQTLSELLGIACVDLDTLDTARLPLDLIEEKLFKQYPILPLWKRENCLWIGMSDPTQLLAIAAIRFQTKLGIIPLIVEHDKLIRLREIHLNNPQLALQFLTPLLQNNQSISEGPAHTTHDPPLVRYTHQLIQTALYHRSSDIHFEPQGKQLHMRFRIDGILYPQQSPPDYLHARIMTRLKIMGSLDIAEQRLPQDGHFQIIGPNQHLVDCRMSTCPTVHGEKIAIRLLDSHQTPLNITALGLNDHQRSLFLETLKNTHGIILMTGPTGSGKTSTLYSALQYLNKESVNIVTAEDPVEIYLSGVNQVNVHAKIGLDTATIMRAFLRQDPDILMIGEMRDPATTEMAIQAAQTGHLVLSTLHTNSTTETFSRLRNLGISNYNTAASVKLIVAQRLLRRLCQHCKQAEPCSQHETPIFKAQGCQHCQSGYRGRIGIFELLPITDTMIQSILGGQAPSKIAAIAQQTGMITLKQAALAKVKQGLTSLAEVARVI